MSRRPSITRSSHGCGRRCPRTSPSRLSALRRENLAGLSGPGARGRRGHRHQLRVLPRHRDRGRRRRTRAPARGAGARRPPPPRRSRHRQHRHRRAVLPPSEPFDAVVCSLVLCSVDDPERVVHQLLSLLRPGGELRYLEHVASSGSARPAAEVRRRDAVAADARATATRIATPRRRIVERRLRA